MAGFSWPNGLISTEVQSGNITKYARQQRQDL